MLTLAPECSPWQLRPAVAALWLLSRTVAEGPTCGAQVAAVRGGQDGLDAHRLRRADLTLVGR
jgi:hypothetical protein